MNDLGDRLDGLALRVQALEDELAITRLLVRYGFAVDTDDVEAMLQAFDPDVRITVDCDWHMRGHDEARAIVEGPTHQSYLPRCAHQVGALTVVVEGDRAEATGYSTVHLREEDRFTVERLSFNSWRLERAAAGWKIVERQTAMLGSGDCAQDLLRADLKR
jgi:ketosteroid isomerase-like protein